MEGLAVLREAEDLNLLLISYHHSLPIELECLPEPLDTSLGEAQELVFDIDFGLEQRRDRTALYNFDLNLVRLIVQSDREGGLVMLVGKQRVHILILDSHLRMFLELTIYVRLGYVLDLQLIDVQLLQASCRQSVPLGGLLYRYFAFNHALLDVLHVVVVLYRFLVGPGDFAALRQHGRLGPPVVERLAVAAQRIDLFHLEDVVITPRRVPLVCSVEDPYVVVLGLVTFFKLLDGQLCCRCRAQLSFVALLVRL